ncbi:MAG: hypothetical protein K0M39_06660 [Rhizobium sp.]|nr:hypothetical protein [Rhizobium sp.]
MTLYARYLLSVGLLVNSAIGIAAPPVVSLTYPPQAATFSGTPIAIPVTVTAYDPDGGTIVKLEYFSSATSLGSVSGSIPAPFTVPINVGSAGTYTFSVKATDAQGEVAISNSTTITVYNVTAGNTAPTASVAIPISGSAYSLNNGPVPVRIIATASDSNGVNRIELLVNNIYRGSVPGATLDGNLAFSSPGTYSIVARAYDNLGASADSVARTFNVYAADPGNTAPTSNLTIPAPGASYLPPATITVAATASDPGGSVSRVEFYLDGGLLNVMAAPPYTFPLSGVAVGSHTLRARAYDNLGVFVDSTATQFVVNTPPAVSISAPALISAPASFNLQANATDADANLSKVEFYQGTTLLGEDTSSPYSWPLNNVTWGTYAYTAKAYDALGAVVTSNPVNVVVNQPPTVGLTASSAYGGYNAPADILLTATPADVDGTITKVEFYSGTQLINSRTVSPYTYTVPGTPAGSYTYTAKVYDNRSAVTTSNAVNVTVSPSLSPATFTYDELGRLIGVQH